MTAGRGRAADPDQLSLLDLPAEEPVEREAAPAYSAAQLARLLRLPPPTPEQAAVIEAPPGPGVVVAGAGSGKTETMASRVVWLVANGHVLPEQILGLTFTRKAARELAARIRRRLAQLRSRGLGVPSADGGPEEAGEATVATYDAYAQRIVAEHALRLGREPASRLVTPAMAWQFAARVAEAYDGPMDSVDSALSTVIEAVLSLHGELSGHLVGIEQVEELAADLRETIVAKPRVARTKAAYHADIGKALDRQQARCQLLPIVAEFEGAKRRRDAVDFSDLAALAARLADTFPEVGERERDRYRMILLDEYQDTSHAQLVLLRGLFGAAPAHDDQPRGRRRSGRGHPVTAVGDPCQSIYGWRGASAETLQAFGRHFPTAAGELAPTRTLATSFRNGSAILTAANALSEPLRAAGLVVPELAAHSGNDTGEVIAACHESVEDEAVDIADRVAAIWSADATRRSAGEEGRTVAVLVRRRSQIERIVRALRAHELPVEVVGVGGLLSTPAVADVVATLQVLADPGRGDALMRLLAGARWRIGPRDLDALGRLARQLSLGTGDGPADQSGAGPSNAEPSDAVSSTAGSTNVGAPVAVDETDERSIVDALDALPEQDGTGFSADGLRRMTRLAGELRGLRSRMSQGLVDLIADVIRTTNLDVEVAARTGDVAVSRADLDAFCDVAADFDGGGDGGGADHDGATLTAFLAYLEAAELEERGLEPGQVEVAEERVQVLTVHGAKGLEWDAVFIAGLVDKVFPGAGATDKAWLTDLGALPFPLRGDRDALPRFDVSGAADQGEVKAAYDEFITECGDRARLEERRLAYVAVTRARQLVYCSGYRWDDAVRPRKVGDFLAEVCEVARQGHGTVPVWAPEPDDGATNPVTAEPRTARWPSDPLTERRRVEVEEGAAYVEQARHALSEGIEPPDELAEASGVWQRDVDLLLAERARRGGHGGEVVVELPERLSVSQLVLLRRDPQSLAAQIRRPLPSQPNPTARRGTAFHTWLERRFGSPHLLDIDELPGAADDSPATEEELTALQEAFLASEWANRQPVEVESPFELLIAGVIVRGRADAVFPVTFDDGGEGDAEGGTEGLEVVDWKTGRPPADGEEAAARSVQLAAYRLAWAQLRGLPLERVRAAFHYVPSNTTHRPVDLLDRSGLEDLVARVPGPDSLR